MRQVEYFVSNLLPRVHIVAQPLPQTHHKEIMKTFKSTYRNIGETPDPQGNDFSGFKSVLRGPARGVLKEKPKQEVLESQHH